jgi:cytochrome c2
MADKLWCPTRGYFEIGAGGGADTGGETAAEADSAPVEATTEPAAAAPAAAGAATGGAKLWAPARGYFTVGGGAAAPAAAAAAAPTASAAGTAGAGAAAAARPTEKKAAPVAKKPAAKKPTAAPKAAAPKEPQADPLRDSVKTVPTLGDSAWTKSLGETFFDEPDSETTLYKVSTLNAAFAILSTIMLVYFVAVLWQDYWRPWKGIQRDWNEVLVEGYEGDLQAAHEAAIAGSVEIENEAQSILAEVVGSTVVEAVRAEAELEHGAGREGAPGRVQAYSTAARESLEGDASYQQVKAEAVEARTIAKFADSDLRNFRGDYQAKKFQQEEKKVHLLEKYGDTARGQAAVAELDLLFRQENDIPLEKVSARAQATEAAALAAEEELHEYANKRTLVGTDEAGGDESGDDGAASSVSLAGLEDRLVDIERTITDVEAQILKADANWQNTIRNAPILDALAPSYVIKKRVIADLHEDLNFITVPRIDRCQTCHVNIDEPDPKLADFEHDTWGSVYQSHPRLDLYMSSSSPHAYDSFGCTACHYGDGHSTDFVTASHTPHSDEQKEKWENKYHWHKMHHQDYPMVKRKHLTSSCRKCHSDEGEIEGGGNYNVGYRVIKEYGCYGCHRIKQFDDAEKVGPSLLHLADKVDLAFLYKWVRNPTHFRESTRMPRFFDLTNSQGMMQIQGPDGTPNATDFDLRNGVESLALATYLHSNSERREIASAGLQGDAERGREIFRTTGCLGCHSLKRESLGEPTTDSQLDDLVATAVTALNQDAGTAEGPLKAATTEAREKLSYLRVWLDRLPVGEKLESVYHAVMKPLDDIARLREEQNLGEGGVVAARAAADAIYNRWAHSTFAPDLSALGSKVRSIDWLVDWILDPSRHDSGTVMPSFRFDQDADGVQKATDVATYLLSFRSEEFEAGGVFSVDTPEAARVLDDVVYDYLSRDLDRGAARDRLAKMSPQEKLVYAGHRLIRRYGCFGCHDGIRDVYNQKTVETSAGVDIVYGTFDNAQPIGTELMGWGIKEVSKLDYGHWGHQHNGDYALPKKRYKWAEAKLTDTRRFDVLPTPKQRLDGEVHYVASNRMVQKTPEELLKMPLFGFVEDQKLVDGVVTFLLSLDLDPVQVTKKHVLTAEEVELEKGRRLIEKLNCQGCHRIGAETRYVALKDLPKFSLYDEGAETVRRNDRETESWLARGVHLQGKPTDAEEPGTDFHAFQLISQQIWDGTTMDESAGDEPVSVIELAAKSFPVQGIPPGTQVLPVSGYEEGSIRTYLGPTATERFRAPPVLLGEGARVRGDWLFDFLRNVTMIRPWLKVRMPSFRLTQDEARTLVRWFKIKAGVPTEVEAFEADTYDRQVAALGLEQFNKLQCNSCHPSGGKLPDEPLMNPAGAFDWRQFSFAVPDSSYYVVWREGGVLQHQAGFSTELEAQLFGQQKFPNDAAAFAVGAPWTKSSWGPDLGLASKRLRPEWIFQWLKDPPNFMPGTKMPNFFGSGQDDPTQPHPLDQEGADLSRVEHMQAILRYLVHMKTVNAVAKN